MSRLRLLDLFCCEGGAGEGYRRAGFDVTGVDVEPRFARRYPGAFLLGDALDWVARIGAEFDVIHASPPCQAYSITRHSHGKRHPDLVAATRDALNATGRPWVMENVVGAPLRDPLMLCGTMFDLMARDADGQLLHLKRHRLFESNVFLWGPGQDCRCVEYRRAGIGVGGVYGGGSADRAHAKNVRRGGYTPGKEVRAELIGADWMTLHGLSQSIPPAYTEFLGHQLAEHVSSLVA